MKKKASILEKGAMVFHFLGFYHHKVRDNLTMNTLLLQDMERMVLIQRMIRTPLT